MKKKNITICLLIACYFSFAQGYEFGIVHNSAYNFKVVAIPNFTSSGNTDVSNIGFTIMLPAGNTDIINETSLLASRTWQIDQYTAATLTGAGVGDGTKDAFLITIPPGQSLFSHNVSTPIDLISFDINNMPTSGTINFLLNSDPIAVTLGGALDSFYQSNIDNTSTQNYFMGLASGQESFNFSTLSITTVEQQKTEITIFPNPTSDYIHINSTQTINKVEIFDILGKLILEKTTDLSKINLSSLSQGSYLIKLYTAEGNQTKKIIRAR